MIQAVQRPAREHARCSGRPQRLAHAAPVLGGFGPDPLPAPRTPNPTSQPIDTSHNLPTTGAVPNIMPKSVHKACLCSGRCSAPPNPHCPTERPRARPPCLASSSSPKTGRSTASPPFRTTLQLIRAPTQRRLENDVENSPTRRPELAVDALDAGPRSDVMSGKDPALLRHNGRHFSAAWVDGSVG